ncbi:hypothetical protein Lal_00027180 [Lupinus albus]|nr:hypothetical protein Lal_00027180 [Lupinus albus]
MTMPQLSIMTETTKPTMIENSVPKFSIVIVPTLTLTEPTTNILTLIKPSSCIHQSSQPSQYKHHKSKGISCESRVLDVAFGRQEGEPSQKSFLASLGRQKSKQGESSSKSNPYSLTRLLANDAQRKVFKENFHGRAIFTPKYGKIGNFEFEDFLFPYLLRQQKLFDFCCEANDIYPKLVRVFYCNMNFRKNLTTSHVKGKDIVLDIKTFSFICCDILMTYEVTGFGLLCDWDDYDRKRFYLSICRIPKEEIDGETKVALNLREIKVDIEVVHKMGFVLDPVTRRTYKHRTDHQTSPTDQPEPTAPNQPKVQAPSSSFAAMPSNKIIMDELILVCHHQKGGDCEEDLAPDLDTVLMKTPTSQKEERKKTYQDYRRQSFRI